MVGKWNQLIVSRVIRLVLAARYRSRSIVRRLEEIMDACFEYGGYYCKTE